MSRLARSALLVLFCAAPAASQTNDHLFRSWSLTREPPSPRSAALGGGLDACADDAIAALQNPAALSALHKAEVLGGMAFRTEHSGVGEDVLGSSMVLSFAGGTTHLTPRLAMGAYAAQPYSVGITLSPAERPDGLRDEGSIDAAVRDFGAAFGWEAGPKLHLGASLVARQLSIEGRYAREPGQGTTNLRVGTSANTTALGGAAGLFLLPAASVRLGLVFDPGSSWRVSRTATSPVLGVVLEPAGEYEMRAPTRLSAGLAWKASPRFMLCGQLDRVRWGEVQARLAIAQGAYARSDYSLADAWEAGLGAEVSLAFRRVSVQLRSGARTHAAGTLRYRGSDAVGRAVFVGSGRKATLGIGAGVFTRGGLHVDVSLTSGDGTSVLAGAGLRF